MEGTWDATVAANNVSVPFRIEIDGTGADVHSYFFNGDDRVNPSNSGTFQNASLVLNFDSYATKLEATLKRTTAASFLLRFLREYCGSLGLLCE